MSQFPFARASLGTEDPFKRVKYSLGLVLGVDEFEQEQGYLRGRLDWHQSLAHGAGTVLGLRVEARGSQIFVHPGLAVDPLGRLIRVGAAQSANLADWVAHEANRKQLLPPAGRDGMQKLFIILRHAEEGTDPVAFPGPPERPQERVMLPTRIVETFALSFQGRPVEMPSGALLGDLLSRIEVLDRGPVDAKTIAAEVRALAAGTSGGLQNRVLGVSRENLDAVLNAALRTWVTDVLPALRTEPAEDAGVLLAQLDVKVSEQGELQHVTVDDSARPYLLPVQLMQELLQRRMPGAGPASGRARPDRRTERALSRLDM
ncbi:MAG TPA: hypothetical protein VNT75_08985, partial [Symbiobacteriaceae bacterium]|nr:hypothetical protein [Symbiobacteriaceae bacterium]